MQQDLQAIDATIVADVVDVLARYPLTQNTTLAIGPLDKLAAPA